LWNGANPFVLQREGQCGFKCAHEALFLLLNIELLTLC
jgi:hypothetical protein